MAKIAPASKVKRVPQPKPQSKKKSATTSKSQPIKTSAKKTTKTKSNIKPVI